LNVHQKAKSTGFSWWGAITMGLLTPVAFIWAYTNPDSTLIGKPKREPPAQSGQEEGEGLA
jgi:hypothetical protein